MWTDEEDNLESNLFILVRGIHKSKSLVISYLHEVEINTIYKNLVQLNPSEINVLTMCDKESLEIWQDKKDEGKKNYLKTIATKTI